MNYENICWLCMLFFIWILAFSMHRPQETQFFTMQWGSTDWRTCWSFSRNPTRKRSIKAMWCVTPGSRQLCGPKSSFWVFMRVHLRIRIDISIHCKLKASTCYQQANLEYKFQKNQCKRLASFLQNSCIITTSNVTKHTQQQPSREQLIFKWHACARWLSMHDAYFNISKVWKWRQLQVLLVAIYAHC